MWFYNKKNFLGKQSTLCIESEVKTYLVHLNNRKKSDVAGLGNREKKGGSFGERQRLGNEHQESKGRLRWEAEVLWKKQGLRFDAALNDVLNIIG